MSTASLATETQPEATATSLATSQACPSSYVADPGYGDVALTDVHAPGIACMDAWAVTTGEADNTYRPRDLATRAEFSDFLFRLLDRAGKAPSSTEPGRFTDVPASHPHASAINALAEAGIINGVSATRFAPDLEVNRGQMAALMVRGYEIIFDRTLQPTAGFTDTAGTAHEDSIRRLVTGRITAGYPDGSYRPGEPMTRAQLATFHARYAQLLVANGLTTVPPKGGTVTTWGKNSGFGNYREVPVGLRNVIAVDGGWSHSVALRTDGTVVVWGDYGDGRDDVPAGLTDVVQVAAGSSHVLALREDGTVVGFGTRDSDYEERGAARVPAGLRDVVQIAADSFHSLALTADGTVTAWGDDWTGITDVPTGLDNVVQIATSPYNSVALLRDGTIVSWGLDYPDDTGPPADLANVAAVALAESHGLALKADGTVVVWGDNDVGQLLVPKGLSSVTGVAAGAGFSLALKTDGTVVGWGLDRWGQSSPPADLYAVTSIGTGYFHSLAVHD